MAAITLLLLWLFQFLYLNYLYYDQQVAQVKKISANLLDKEYGINRPSNWNLFNDVAKKQNLNVYIFTMDINEVERKGSYYVFPENTSLRIYSPNITTETSSIKELNWSDEQSNAFLENIKNLGNNTFFTYFEDKLVENAPTDNLIYGSQLKGDFGSKQCYFCLIATISNSNFTVTITNQMLLIASGAILIVSIVMSFLFSKRLSLPINRLAVTANQLAAGDFNVTFSGNSSLKEVELLASSLNFAKEEMSKTEQMRRDFIANVSHDLRTPLTMIKAYAEMIRDLSGKNDEKRTKHCQIIIDESNRLSSLVGDIQTLSKLQSGTTEYNFSQFDLSELCNTVINRFGIMSETQGYVFESDCDPDALCYGDYQKIEQVLYNLISNALNYTGEDKKVIIRCKKDEDFYKVEIKDTGKGIDPSEIDAVWERYYRSNQKKRSIIGSGLGLNIVKMILEGHKAQYGIDSKINEGTTFWFKLSTYEFHAKEK